LDRLDADARRQQLLAHLRLQAGRLQTRRNRCRPSGDPLAIDNGKVDGDKFTFTVAFNGATITHTGTITGDEIKMTTKADQGDFPGAQLTLKRSSPNSPPAATPHQ
jgi:hypothetical protein